MHVFGLPAFGISKYRVQEIIAFCRQYGEKKRLLAAAASLKAQNYDVTPHGNSVSDPTFDAVARRERYARDVSIIENAARAVDPAWSFALIENVCFSVAYSKIPQSRLPTANRAAYFKARREFILRINAEFETLGH